MASHARDNDAVLQHCTCPHLLTCSCENAGIDGGGSLRVPAAMCGVVGLRPTVGRTSIADCAPNSFSIMGFGPIAASVADAMIVYAVMGNAGELSRFA